MKESACTPRENEERVAHFLAEHRSCIDARFRVFLRGRTVIRGHSIAIKLNPRASSFIGKPSFSIPFALLPPRRAVSSHRFKYECERVRFSLPFRRTSCHRHGYRRDSIYRRESSADATKFIFLPLLELNENIFFSLFFSFLSERNKREELTSVGIRTWHR